MTITFLKKEKAKTWLNPFIRGSPANRGVFIIYTLEAVYDIMLMVQVTKLNEERDRINIAVVTSSLNIIYDL